MIRVFNLYNNKTTEITNLCKSISISGSKTEVARKLEVSLLYSIFDENHPKYTIVPGSKILVTKDGKEIFQGVVWERQINSNQELTFTSYDYLIYLLKSKITYNVNNSTPENAVKKMCSELGVPVGNLVSTGINVKRIIAQKSGYEAIMEVYTQASKHTGKKYIPIIINGKLNVIQKGTVVANLELKPEENILNTTYKDTLESMINCVKIYDDKGKYIGKVENPSWLKSFGLLQENYVKEDKVNPNIAAKNILHGVEQECDVECLGNWNCRTGYAVKAKIWYLSNLADTVMFIDGDTHSWEIATEKYTMQLNLSFSNLMDTKEG